MTTDLERRLRRDLGRLDEIDLPPFDPGAARAADVVTQTPRRSPLWLSIAAAMLLVLGTAGLWLALDRGNDSAEPVQAPPSSPSVPPMTEPVDSQSPLRFDIERIDDWPLHGVNRPTAVWTGEQAIVFGGLQGDGDTSRKAISFDPQTRETGVLSDIPRALGAHGQIAAADTSNLWVVGGGDDPEESARLMAAYHYNIDHDEWSPIAPAPVPTNDLDPWVFTGEDLYIWPQKSLPHRYDEFTDTWVELPAPPGRPSSPTGAASVWTGDEWIIWGGATSDGYAYDPDLDTWRTLPDVDLPGRQTTGVWNGKEMIIPPGRRGNTMAIGGTAAYDPATNTWRTLNAGPQHPGLNAVAVDRFLVAFFKGSMVVLDPDVALDPEVGPVGIWYERLPQPFSLPTSAFLWTGNEILALDASWTDPAIMTPK